MALIKKDDAHWEFTVHTVKDGSLVKDPEPRQIVLEKTSELILDEYKKIVFEETKKVRDNVIKSIQDEIKENEKSIKSLENGDGGSETIEKLQKRISDLKSDIKQLKSDEPSLQTVNIIAVHDREVGMIIGRRFIKFQNPDLTDEELKCLTYGEVINLISVASVSSIITKVEEEDGRFLPDTPPQKKDETTTSTAESAENKG